MNQVSLPEAKRILKLFNEKAERLSRLSLARELAADPLRLRLERRNGEAYIEFDAPNEEQVDAFVLTLRFFIQDNEPTSLKRMADLYEQLAIPAELREAYLAGRARLNHELGDLAPVTLDGRQITQRELFEIVVWGGLAHANPKKQRQFEVLAGGKGDHFMFAPVFMHLLGEFLTLVAATRTSNLAALKYLDSRAEGRGAA